MIRDFHTWNDAKHGIALMFSNCKSYVAISNHFPSSSWLPRLHYPLAQTLQAPQPSEWPTGFWKLNWHPAAERPSEHLTDFSASIQSEDFNSCASSSPGKDWEIEQLILYAFFG